MITRRKMLLSSAAALLTGSVSMLLGRKLLEAVNTVTTAQPTPIMPPIQDLSLYTGNYTQWEHPPLEVGQWR